MTQGPIVIIEDDLDDREIYAEAIQSLGIQNDLVFFANGKEALNYLLTSEDQPFVIISDINMPEMNGLELKRAINDDPYLCTKGIPFIFISTSATKVSVRHAYALSVQGYFEKPQDFTELQTLMKKIFGYWETCRHINNT